LVGKKHLRIDLASLRTPAGRVVRYLVVEYFYWTNY